MKDLYKEKQNILSEIEKLGYDSLRYSIFDEHIPLEWETRIDFDDVSGEYEVYSTMYRASILGSYKYTDFDEAKARFIRNLEMVVSRYQYLVEEGKNPPYSSPLWDKADD